MIDFSEIKTMESLYPDCELQIGNSFIIADPNNRFFDYYNERNYFLATYDNTCYHFKLLATKRDGWIDFWDESFLPEKTIYQDFIDSTVYTVSPKKRKGKIELTITDVADNKAYFNYLKEKHRFTEVTPQLEKLGFTQRFIDSLEAGYNYFGINEICSCEIIGCFSRAAWIIKERDSFSIPFLHVESGSSYYFEMDIETIEPTPPEEDPEIAPIFPFKESGFSFYEKCVFKNEF